MPTELVKSRLVGSASGIILAVCYIGAVGGPWISGYIRDLFGDFFYVLVMLMVVAVISALLTFLLPETERRYKVLSFRGKGTHHSQVVYVIPVITNRKL